MDLQSISEDIDDIIAIRRHIHAHPELAFEEAQTAALVESSLRKYGLDVTTGMGGHGVIGTLKGRNPEKRSIGLRADMDALPMTEGNELEYASCHPGRMHACGHDGHTAMLLGAAKALGRNPNFEGTVHFIFQPAEEGGRGAKAMIADGLFERFPCDRLFGMHSYPTLPVGAFGIRMNDFMAAAGRFEVTFHGTGGHGGLSPHLSSDLTLAQANFILGLQAH